MKFLRLLLVTTATAGLVAGCGSSDNNDNTGGGVAFSLFTPATAAQVPFPINLFFGDATNTSGPVAGLAADGTLNIPNASNAPFVSDANRQDGFSTSATFFTDFVGADLDPATYPAAVHVYQTSPRAQFRELVQSTDGVTGDYALKQSSVITTRPRLLFQPLTPLNPGATYTVVVTRDLRPVGGTPIGQGEEFQIVASPDPVGSPNNPATNFSDAQRATLAQVRQRLIRPIFDGLIDPAQGPDPTPNIAPEDVLIAWAFTTQSISDTLDVVAANPTVGAIGVAPAPDGMGGQLSTGEANPGAPDTANIFGGSVTLPYFLNAPDVPADPNALTQDASVLRTFFASVDDNAGGFSVIPAPSGPTEFIPCAAFAQSESTTRCYPEPMQRSMQTIPVLVTVPNSRAMPAAGWPVVIAQHGITGNRTQMLGIAPALASAGFVTVAIDLPLPGVPPNSPSRIPNVRERTFFLDLVNNATGAPNPAGSSPNAPGDGIADPSGTHFINLPSVITSRDNIREGVADLINLNATLQNGPIPIVNATTGMPTGSIMIDPDNIQFFGHSLGAITGTTLLGVTGDELGAATLANPGGGIARLLDGSIAFGPRIAAGLAAVGVVEGTDNYETFLRFAQTVTDAADPINYGVAAAANHDIHLIEVVGGANGGNNPPDLVVPNSVPRNVAAGGPCPASANFLPFLDTICEVGVLSGTDPLVRVMDLTIPAPISPPYSQQAAQPADSAIRFTAGDHGSILTPLSSTPGVSAADAAATNCEMQRQTATFLAMAANPLVASPTIPIGPATCPSAN